MLEINVYRKIIKKVIKFYYCNRLFCVAVNHVVVVVWTLYCY